MVMRNQDVSEWRTTTLLAEFPFAFFLFKVEKGGSAHAWIALSLSSRLSPSFWTSQSCFISSGFSAARISLHIQLNLSTATLGTGESSYCRELTVVERFKQESMCGLLAKKKMAVLERWPLVEVRLYILMVVTEPSITSARPLGLGSKLYPSSM